MNLAVQFKFIFSFKVKAIPANQTEKIPGVPYFPNTVELPVMIFPPATALPTNARGVVPSFNLICGDFIRIWPYPSEVILFPFKERSFWLSIFMSAPEVIVRLLTPLINKLPAWIVVPFFVI